eukprot:jgi/Ulvmu1/6694/UM030_0025.1
MIAKRAMLFLLGLLLAWAHAGTAHPQTDRKLKRLAVIGSGMGGATAAWLVHNATGCEVTVYEASDVVGGRLKETTIDGRVVELGGSIGIEANQYFVQTTDLLGLNRTPQPSTSAGIWNGHEFVFKSSDSIFTKFLRYGLSSFILRPIVKNAVESFNKVYDLQAMGQAYDTAEDLWEALGLAHLMNVTLHDHLQDSSRFLGIPLINHNYINEAAAAATRVNYNQNPSTITALAGLIALAPNDGAFTVDGGTGQMPAGLLKLAKADVKLSHHVTKIERDGDSWKVIVGDGAAAQPRRTGSGQQEHDGRSGDAVGGWFGPDKYDAVIIAAPLNQSGIAVEGLGPGKSQGKSSASSDVGDNLPGGSVEYQTVYTTYVKAKVRDEFFMSGREKEDGEVDGGEERDRERVPGFVGTTEGSAAGFSCIGTLNASVDGNGTRLMKLFSTEKLQPGLLDRMFVAPEVPAEQRWKAYPVFRVPERAEGRMRIAAGLYYVNALEAGASCVEIAAVAARNVVALLLRDMAHADVVGAADAAVGVIQSQREL